MPDINFFVIIANSESNINSGSFNPYVDGLDLSCGLYTDNSTNSGETKIVDFTEYTDYSPFETDNHTDDGFEPAITIGSKLRVYVHNFSAITSLKFNIDFNIDFTTKNITVGRTDSDFSFNDSKYLGNNKYHYYCDGLHTTYINIIADNELFIPVNELYKMNIDYSNGYYAFKDGDTYYNLNLENITVTITDAE